MYKNSGYFAFSPKTDILRPFLFPRETLLVRGKNIYIV